MRYGELNLGIVCEKPQTRPNQFQIGNTPHNKGRRWQEWMSVEGHAANRRPHHRSPLSGKQKKQVVAVFEDGEWVVFPHAEPAAKWIDCRAANIRRCCQFNQKHNILRKSNGRPTGIINTDHKYKGVRFYFVDDNTWTTKIKKT